MDLVIPLISSLWQKRQQRVGESPQTQPVLLSSWLLTLPILSTDMFSMWTVVFWLILANSLSNPPKFLISKTGELSNQKSSYSSHILNGFCKEQGFSLSNFPIKNEWENLFSEKADRGSSQVRSKKKGGSRLLKKPTVSFLAALLQFFLLFDKFFRLFNCQWI